MTRKSERGPWGPAGAMGTSLIVLLVFSALSGSVQSSDEEVECVMNTWKVLTCTWNPTDNFTFYYWEGSEEVGAVPCPHYLTVRSVNTGCEISISDPYNTLSTKLDRRTRPPIFTQLKRPQDYVKLEAPHNLSAENSNNLELTLRWYQSYGAIPTHCVMFRVRHRTAASDTWTEKEASSRLSVLSSFDVCQNYTFHVKSRMSSICANAFLWSDWSDGVTWARNATLCEESPVTKPSFGFMHTAITVGLTLLLVVIFLAVIGQERIWVILVPQIPNPGKKFEDLINGCNVQEWVGVSKEAVEKMKLNYTETLCIVTEDGEEPMGGA